MMSKSGGNFAIAGNGLSGLCDNDNPDLITSNRALSPEGIDNAFQLLDQVAEDSQTQPNAVIAMAVPSNRDQPHEPTLIELSQFNCSRDP
jgi:hypothetical protein